MRHNDGDQADHRNEVEMPEDAIEKPKDVAGSPGSHCSTVCAVCNWSSYSVLPEVGGKRMCHICKSKHLHPWWPRGRYNGQRIVGLSFKIALDVTDWRWKPLISKHSGCFHWLCVRSWTEAVYE